MSYRRPPGRIQVRRDLMDQILTECGIQSRARLASVLGVGHDAVRRALSGETSTPLTFIDAYCWVFDLTLGQAFEIVHDE